MKKIIIFFSLVILNSNVYASDLDCNKITNKIKKECLEKSKTLNKIKTTKENLDKNKNLKDLYNNYFKKK
tara:strand:+ start:871 stop:1080 length:210 start_codon:yes stop_codon:yes gene_type:complete